MAEADPFTGCMFSAHLKREVELTGDYLWVVEALPSARLVLLKASSESSGELVLKIRDSTLKVLFRFL